MRSLLSKLKAVLALALTLSGLSVVSAAPVTLNMGDGSLPIGAAFAPAASYLSSYGVSIIDLTLGTTLQMEDARFSYNSDPYGNPNGSAMRASSPYNVLSQAGTNNDPAFYTLGFGGGVSDLSFYRAGAALDAATPEWKVDIYDGTTVIASVGQPLNGYCCNSYPQLYSFNAATYGHSQITSMRVYSNNHHFAAFSTVAIDDLTFTPIAAAIPEPTSAALLLAGLTALGWNSRRRRS